jgi:hypothetical protein
MKLLFENWRSYQKEVLEEQLDMISHSAPYDKDGHPIDPDITKGLEDFGKEINRNSQLRSLLFSLASVADPTGVSGYKDFKIAKAGFIDGPGAKTAAMLLLAFLGTLPVAGALTKPIKLLKMKQALKSASKIRKTLQKTAGNAEITKKVVQAEAEAVAAVNKAQKAVAKAAPATARATGKVMKIQRGSAMYHPDGYSYVIVKTTDGPIAFYKSSGTGELPTKDWLPIFGWNGKGQVMKLGSHHRDARSFPSPDGIMKKGKYAIEGSEINKIGKTLEAEGAFKGVSKMWRSPADFLSHNINTLTPGMPMEEIVDQLNRGLQQMGRKQMHPEMVEDIAINLHLNLNGVNTKLSSMTGSGIPGVTSVINKSDFIKALNMGK